MSLVIAAPAPITIPVAGGGSFPVRRIYCVGRNYEEHAKEMGFTGREPPFFFMKPADAIVNVAEGTIGAIPYPAGTSNLHYEIELVAKKEGRPWEIGKAFDQSAPIGPIVPAAAAGNPGNAAITLSVNGQMKQSSSTSKLIWSIAESIEHLTTYWRLEPGDLIFTGTPEGVGAVVSGDLMEGAVAGVGSLKVQVR